MKDGPGSVWPSAERLRIDRELRQAQREIKQRDEFLSVLVADYDRRRRTRHGRFLLWLLRQTT